MTNTAKIHNKVNLHKSWCMPRGVGKGGKERGGEERGEEGFSGFQVTGMIEGCFWVWVFRFQDYFGYSKQSEDSW